MSNDYLKRDEEGDKGDRYRKLLYNKWGWGSPDHLARFTLLLYPLLLLFLLTSCSIRRAPWSGLPEIFEEEPGLGWGVKGSRETSHNEYGECRELKVYFPFDDYQITEDNRERISKFVEECLIDHKNIILLIEGHCDERGSTEYNLALGQKRADEIKRFLKEFRIQGIDIKTISYGEERPELDEKTEEAWARNRRGVLNILYLSKNSGKEGK